jgi:hypothetical protein
MESTGDVAIRDRPCTVTDMALDDPAGPEVPHGLCRSQTAIPRAELSVASQVVCECDDRTRTATVR